MQMNLSSTFPFHSLIVPNAIYLSRPPIFPLKPNEYLWVLLAAFDHLCTGHKRLQHDMPHCNHRHGPFSPGISCLLYDKGNIEEVDVVLGLLKDIPLDHPGLLREKKAILDVIGLKRSPPKTTVRQLLFEK
jgi:hypothetical protein